tara:strand:+ start:1066 stop:1374 length:309 start_codon:yes stop_codon:yes gene_type:complete
MTKKKKQEKKEENVEFDARSYALGLTHGRTRAVYLIKLCLDGFKDVLTDDEAFSDFDEVTAQRKKNSCEISADACNFVLSFVTESWDDKLAKPTKEEVKSDD